MRLAFGVLVLAAGCWSTKAPPGDTISNTADPGRVRAGAMVITADHFGPIEAKTAATLANLRKLVFPYEVRALNDPGLELHIYKGTEQLAFVVLNEDMTVFNVHATSGKVAVSDRAWRVDEPFQGSSDLTQCECWGENPTCYKKGEHVAVNFKRSCDGLTNAGARALKALDGIIVQRVIWSPTAFGAESSSYQGYGGDAYGGGDPCGGP